MVKTFSFVLVLLTWSGCSGGITKCLETPISSKVSQESVEACHSALQTNPDRQDLFHIYLGLLRVRQQYAEIEQWSQRILARDPSRTDATYNLAFALRKRGDCAGAVKQYQAYANTNTKDPDPYYGLGLCFEHLGDTAQARQSYQAYIKREQRQSQQAWVANAKARLEALSGSPLASAPPRGAAALKSPLAARPAVRPSMATLRPRLPAAKPAVTAKPPVISPPAARPPAAKPAPAAADCSTFERAFTSDPFALEAYDRFAACAYAAGRYKDVIKRMRVALRDNPDFHRAWMHLGKALKATGELTQSKIAISRACSAGVAEACGL